MLKIFDGQKPMNRRELLRVGTLGLGGLSLSSLLGVKALAKGQPNPLTGKSVIFLFQQGGPSQHETFAPKPDAPSGVRSVGVVIPTSVPGTHFSGWMPHLAKLADKVTVVRSLNTENSGQVGALDEIQQQAAEVLLGGGVSAALDLSREDPRVLARYDTSRYKAGEKWNSVTRGTKGYYNAQAGTIGKLLLQARRLCEAGAGYVTIHASYAGVWDMHADGNNLNMQDGMDAVGYSFDHAVAAFIEDCEARGLSDKIMLVCCGEMGRTPKLNKRGGRDHWAKLAPLMIYGGGFDGGRVIGQSDRMGGEPVTDAFTPRHMISTILRSVIDPGQLRLLPNVPKEVTELLDHPPITGLG